MRVFISLPMKDKTEEEIKNNLKNALEEVRSLSSSSMELLDTYIDLGPEADGFDYIAESIKLMKKADAIYFYDNWKESKGCLIERVVAELYCPDKIIQKK